VKAVKTGHKDAMSDALAAGNDTARVSAADAEERRLRQIAARQYLDGRFPRELADELADILGLAEQPARVPGHCSCGEVLPMSSATSSPTCRPGFCAKCTADPMARDRAPQAIAVPEPAPGPPSGECGWCERTYQLTHLGRLRRHNAWVVRSGVVTRVDQDCPGSWELPEDTRG
jgi:hypothetical protein